MNNVNKYGVPYHQYHLYLSNHKIVDFDMAWEESWGDVNSLAFDRRNGTQSKEPFVGYGNDVDGYYKILKVYDNLSQCFITPDEFVKRCESYTTMYST